MYWLFRIDWRGRWVVSPFFGDALMKVEENVASDAGTVLVRMTEFYGLSREDWLSLVIKVSPTVYVAEGSTAVFSWRNMKTK
jgi:hypothetical protein